jgi:hypothetical protein
VRASSCPNSAISAGLTSPLLAGHIAACRRLRLALLTVRLLLTMLPVLLLTRLRVGRLGGHAIPISTEPVNVN